MVGLAALRRGDDFSRAGTIPIDRRVNSSDHIQIRISKAAAMAGPA
jgi:hypothetical protein